MAISGVSSTNSSYRDNWESNGGIYGNENTDGTSGTESTEKIWNAVFTDKKQSAVSTEDFLSLMVAQMTNQDFMNPMDDTQFVTQLAQFSSMQMMQEMSNYTKTSYVLSLVGKDVTAARITVSGELIKETGPVQKVSLTNNEFGIYVNGKKFTLEQLMEVGKTGETDSSGNPIVPEEDTTERKTYLNSLLGYEVTVSETRKDDDGQEYEYEATGVVEKVSSKDGKYRVCIGGKWFSLGDVIEVGDKVGAKGDDEEELPPVTDTNPAEDEGKVEETDPIEETGPVGTDTPVDTTESLNPDEKVDPDIETGDTTEPETTDTDEDEAVKETQEV